MVRPTNKDVDVHGGVDSPNDSASKYWIEEHSVHNKTASSRPQPLF